MKSLSLIAVGLAIALSVGAQTTTDEKQDQTQPTGKAKAEQKVDETRTSEQGVKERDRTRVNDQEKPRSVERHDAQVNEREKTVGPNERTGAQVQEQGGTVLHSTTVFRNGRETNEHIDLHRGFRERTDVHFGIGTHPRDWWLHTYSIVLMEGCPYYLADNGCWYPAYGFQPGCNYPDGVVFCE